jgi:hypothetical protein
MQGFFPTHGLTHEKALHGGYRFSLARTRIKTSKSSNPAYGVKTAFKTLTLGSLSGSISITVETSTP